MVPAFEFLSYDELLIVAFVALVLVLRNLWTFVRYDLDHVEAEASRLAPHPLEGIATVASHALAAAAFPHAGRTAPRPMVRRRAASQRLRLARPALKTQPA